ncbi:MAG: hypothetical protein MSS85_07635 [Pyramidobacter sp.]|uniref:hypothetical protein n=1 Tax=Pyramidobacter sp. TaxID=1943581 RepID=UPI0025DFA4EA|nr:hypothetical protein [Pyramidobacter sp.]MCI7403941.1 hypothetical protein [Pyramidobacter sp.]
MAGFRAERGFSPLLASRLALINSELEELTIGQVGEIMARYSGMDGQMKGLTLEQYDERMAMAAEGRERTADDIKKAWESTLCLDLSTTKRKRGRKKNGDDDEEE